MSTLPPNIASTSSGFVGQTLSNTSGLGSNFTNTSGLSSNISTGSGMDTTVSSAHGTQPPTPSPRRKSSSTSNEGDLYCNYRENFRVSAIYVAGDYHNQAQTEFPETNGSQYSGHFTGRDDIYRNERSPYNYDRNSEYVSKHRNPDSNYIVFNGQTIQMKHPYPADSEHPHAYDNPSISHNNRTPVRLPYNTHRRTNSNISVGSSNNSNTNLNQGYRLETDETGPGGYSEHFYRRSHSSEKYVSTQKTGENLFSLPLDKEFEAFQIKQPNADYSWKTNEYTNPREFFSPRQNSQESGIQERPGSLGFELGTTTKLRSSLKKYSSQKKSGSGSGGGTPTNPTPPDSLTSEDSSYVSAKDSSGSGSRVRFSPETLAEHGGSPQQSQERRPSRHS